MRVENEPANVGFLQEGIEAFGVAAFRQPKTARIAPERFAVVVATDANLSALRFGKLLEQREEGVGRRARHDLETARVLQLAKCPDDVALEGFDIKVARRGEELEVEMREVEKLRMSA